MISIELFLELRLDLSQHISDIDEEICALGQQRFFLLMLKHSRNIYEVGSFIIKLRLNNLDSII